MLDVQSKQHRSSLPSLLGQLLLNCCLDVLGGAKLELCHLLVERQKPLGCRRVEVPSGEGHQVDTLHVAILVKRDELHRLRYHNASHLLLEEHPAVPPDVRDQPETRRQSAQTRQTQSHVNLY